MRKEQAGQIYKTMDKKQKSLVKFIVKQMYINTARLIREGVIKELQSGQVDDLYMLKDWDNPDEQS